MQTRQWITVDRVRRPVYICVLSGIGSDNTLRTSTCVLWHITTVI